MKLPRLVPACLLFAFAIPTFGQIQQREVNSLLNAASNALDRWDQLAPSIHCEDATQKEFSNSCKTDLETMKERVQESEAEIARYRQLSNPQVVNLFDVYESFRRAMEVVENLKRAPAVYGERNRQVFAEAYDPFGKVNVVFRGVMRTSIQNAANCSDPAHD